MGIRHYTYTGAFKAADGAIEEIQAFLQRAGPEGQQFAQKLRDAVVQATPIPTAEEVDGGMQVDKDTVHEEEKRAAALKRLNEASADNHALQEIWTTLSSVPPPKKQMGNGSGL